MAFWDSWFKTACEQCGKKFKKDALVEHDERQVCASCNDSLAQKAKAKEVERLERMAQEEAARARLGDRNFNN